MEKLIPQIRSLGSPGKGCGVHTPHFGTGEPKHPSGHPPYLRGSNFSSTPQGGLLSRIGATMRELIICKSILLFIYTCFRIFRIPVCAMRTMVFNTFGGKTDRYRGFLIPAPAGIRSGYGVFVVRPGLSRTGAALPELVQSEQTS